MKRMFFMVALIAITSLNSVAQINNIDLSKYKLPEMKRHTFDMSFNLEGSTESINRAEDEENSYNGYLNLYYALYKNNEHYQGSSNLYFFSNGRIQNEINNEYLDSKNNIINPRLGLLTRNRFYYKGTRFFWDWW